MTSDNNDNENLTKRDLLNFIEAYQNMMQSHNILMEEQKKTSNEIVKIQELLANCVDKHEDILEREYQIIDKLKEKLDPMSDTQKDICKGQSDLKDSLSSTREEITKQHTGLSLKIYAIYALMAGIMIPLISTMHITDEILPLLKEIALALGVVK